MSEPRLLMAGKRGLIMGVANDRSIAWGIAKAVAAQGAELAFTYQGEALEKRVRPLAAGIGADKLLPCDVTDAASLDACFASARERLGRVGFRRPCHRLLRQGRAQGQVRRHVARQLPAHARHLLLFVHRRVPPRDQADAQRRQPAHPHLLRRRAGDAALQRHGRGQGGARGERALPRCRPRRRTGSASTRSRRDRSRRWRRPASAISATS